MSESVYETGQRQRRSRMAAIALGLGLSILCPLGVSAQPSALAGTSPQPSALAAPPSAPPSTQTITFKQPRVTGLARLELRKFAKRIAPSKNNPYKLEHVDVDVYVNPASNDFTRTAAANMGNEVARRLVRYGIPGDRISHSTRAQESAQTKPGTYDVQLRATPAL